MDQHCEMILDEYRKKYHLYEKLDMAGNLYVNGTISNPKEVDDDNNPNTPDVPLPVTVDDDLTVAGNFKGQGATILDVETHSTQGNISVTNKTVIAITANGTLLAGVEGQIIYLVNTTNNTRRVTINNQQINIGAGSSRKYIYIGNKWYQI